LQSLLGGSNCSLGEGGKESFYEIKGVPPEYLSFVESLSSSEENERVEK